MCQASSCTADPAGPAKVIIGQPDAFSASCNGDNTSLAVASERTLCAVPYPYQISPLEGPRGNSLATDAQHNLYLVDLFNNRALKYADPLGTDNVADAVWGQPNFINRSCNQGYANPTPDTLCTGDPLHFYPNYFFSGGLDVSSSGNVLWVADLGNHRVVRYSNGSKSADLVLGQNDPYSNDAIGCSDPSRLDRLCRPNAVRWDENAKRLYVVNADPDAAGGARVFVYDNPSYTGQAATSTLGPPAGSSFLWPRGVTLDPTRRNAVWLSDSDNSRIIQYVDGVPTRVLGQPDFQATGCADYLWTGPLKGHVCNMSGAVGVDRDGSVYAGDMVWQHATRFPNPIPTPPELAGAAYSPDTYFFEPGCYGWANQVGPSGFANPGDVRIVGARVYVADRQRILFWDGTKQSDDGKGRPASGVLGQPSPHTQCDDSISHGQDYARLAYDERRDLLYAVHGNFITAWERATTLNSGDPPSFEIASPLPLAGSNEMLAFRASGMAIDADADTAWVSDSYGNRIFRILDVSRVSRQVDVILGQSSLYEYGCNRGMGRGSPQRDGFCIPTQVVFDSMRNLYVVDGTWEGNGNQRVIEFDAESLPAVPSKSLLFASGEGPMPSRVYAKPTFAATDCDPDNTNQPCTPIGVSFEPRTNRMLMVTDGYGNPLNSRAFVYDAPLAKEPRPTNTLEQPFNQPAASDWRPNGDLLVLDHTWNRVVEFACAKAPNTRDRRCVCPTVFRPVCGCDGITYGNSCEAGCHVYRWTEGVCSSWTTSDPPETAP